MRKIMDKMNPNVLVATMGAIAIAVFASITVLTLNGVSSDQLTFVLTAGITTISALIASVSATRTHSVKQDTTKLLNGTMDAKILNGVKAALVDLGIVHTVAQPLATAETAVQHVEDTLTPPTPDAPPSPAPGPVVLPSQPLPPQSS
jgi:hypothetical protein